MKRGMFVLALVAIVGLCSVPVWSAGAKKAAGGKVYIYGLWNMMGKNPQYETLIKRSVNLLFDKMGEKVRIQPMSQSQAYAAIRNRKVDFTTLNQSDFVKMKLKGVEVHPAIATSVVGHVNEFKCLVVPKSSTAKKITDLKGKRFAVGNNEGDYFGDRWYLKSKGADVTLSKFFSKVLIVDDDITTLRYVIQGKADGAMVSKLSLNFQKLIDSGALRKVREVECTEFPWPGAPVVWVGKPDKVLTKKMYDVLAKLETYPEFKQLKPLLTNTLKMKLNFVSDADYNKLMGMYRTGIKNHWDKEFAAAK